MKMEGSVGSGVLKKKSSSGCLIIKKKGLSKNSGGGLGGLSDSSNEKKRARLVASDSSSSDEDECLEIMRRRVNDKRLKNGSMGYKRNELESRELDSDNAGIEDSAERKRSRLDLFEFDEYDEFDGKKMRKEFSGDRFKKSGRIDCGKMKESGLSSKRKFVVDKRKQGSYFNSSSSGKSKEKGHNGARNKEIGLEEDDAHMPISLLKLKYQETAGESIRLQGKNGVLKVMVKKKKNMEFPSQPEDHDLGEHKERKRSDDVVKKELSVPLPVHSALKTSKSRGLIVDKEKSAEKKIKETKLEKVKQSSSKGKRAGDSEVDGAETVSKLATPRPQASSSKKGVKKEAESSPGPENFTPVKGKEGKEGSAKRGGSTEKQILREKIRAMLLDAGWTIDYRPRRNRDYLDAVYINPSGTAYWSIVKAYDAFKKQCGEDTSDVKADVGSPSFAPLSEDLINKLTRQTKKKIAEEMRRKRKEDKSTKKSAGRDAAESSDSDQSEERLSFFMKQKQRSRGKLAKVDEDSHDDLRDDSPKRKSKKVRVEKSSTASKSNIIQGRTSKVIGRCTLLVRGSDRGGNTDFDGYVPYSGKRTVLAWLIDSGTAKLSEKVQYMNRRRSRVMLEGWITRDGIHCGCCSKILAVSKFELHAGSKLRQPFQNIYLESGSSLLQCQIDAWNNQEESLRRDFFTVDVDGDDPDDDTCGICGDGGDLICCDSCPSTFHQICLGIQLLPLGDWHCPNCTCKFCGYVGGNVSEESNSAGDELKRCDICEKKYHKSCRERVDGLPMSSNGASFCGRKCKEICDHLQKIIGVKHELEAGISWSLIQRTDVSDTSQRGFPLRVECNSKLAVALSVMDECFLPIIDRRSGINIIHNVVYNCGSNFNRLNFCGFYTAILERGDEIISAASIRLHGDRLAEMPFIATREIYRRQGMCRRLLSAIETELRLLKVGRLIIPAISEHTNTWTTIFDFHELKDVHKKEMKSMNMLVFPGTDMLQKQLVKQESSDGKKISGSTDVLDKNSEVNSSLEQSTQSSSDSEECLVSKTEDEVDALESGPPVPANPSITVCKSDNTVPSATDAACESDSEECLMSKTKDKAVALKSGSPVPTVSSNAESDNAVPSATDAVCESDSQEFLVSKTKDEVDALESGPPLPAAPSNADCESDNTVPSATDAVSDSEECLVSKTKDKDEAPESAILSNTVLESDNTGPSATDAVCEPDSVECLVSKSKTKDEVDAPESGPPVSAVPSNTVCESDNTMRSAADAVCESESEEPLASKTTDEVDALESGPPVSVVPTNTVIESDNTVPSATDAVCESDAVECLVSKSKTKDEVDAPESGPPVSAIPSNPVCESDNTIPSAADAGCESEFEEPLASKSTNEVDALESGPPVSAVPTNTVLELDNTVPISPDAVCESDIHLLTKETTASKPEEENVQKESSDNLNCSPNSAQNNNSFSVAVDAFKTEAPCPNSILNSPDKTQNPSEATGIESGTASESTEDAEPPETINGSVESPPYNEQSIEAPIPDMDHKALLEEAKIDGVDLSVVHEVVECPETGKSETEHAVDTSHVSSCEALAQSTSETENHVQ